MSQDPVSLCDNPVGLCSKVLHDRFPVLCHVTCIKKIFSEVTLNSAHVLLDTPCEDPSHQAVEAVLIHISGKTLVNEGPDPAPYKIIQITPDDVNGIHDPGSRLRLFFKNS